MKGRIGFLSRIKMKELIKSQKIHILVEIKNMSDSNVVVCHVCEVTNYEMTIFLDWKKTREDRFRVKYCLPCWNAKNGLPYPGYGGERKPNPSGGCGIWEVFQDKLDEEERYASNLLTTRGMTSSC